LATVRDPVNGGRDPKYIKEYFDLAQVIWKALERIHKRDGTKILKEVAEELVNDIDVDVELAQELAQEKRGDRRTRRADNRSTAAH
jgi:hypothetical protein